MAQIDAPVSAFLPALEETSVERLPAAAEDMKVGRDDAFLETGEPDRHFERGSWRVAPLERTILQRPKVVGVELRPRRAIDADRECVRVVGRTTGEREYFAIPRIEDDGGAIETGGFE